MKSSADSRRSELQQLPTNWRSRLAIVCALGGVFLMANASIVSILSRAYPFPPPRVSYLWQIVFALALIAIGLLFIRRVRAPLRKLSLLWFYFAFVGFVLLAVTSYALILRRTLSPIELAIMGTGALAAGVGILVLRADNRGQRQSRDAI